jgi:hypothetical protein
MGIKVKNLDNYVLTFKYNKTLTATLNQDVQLVPFSGFISNVVGRIGSGGTGVTNTIIDLNYEGSTIFGAATKITFAATTGVASYSDLTTKPYHVTYGAMMSIDIDQIAANPMNAIVEVVISRQPLNTADNLLDLSTVR